MRIQVASRTQGSVLAMTVFYMTIALVAVGSCLFMISNQYRSVARAASWNSAMPIAESGVEEALTTLYLTGTNAPGNNWTLGTDGFYHKSRTVGSDGSYYNVCLQMATAPIIVSTGYVHIPTSSSAYVRRIVQVVTQKANGGAGGLNARGKISMSGGAFVDSFDSSDPNYSTNGVYTSSKRKANAQVVSNSPAVGAIALTGGGIYGSASTGVNGSVTTSGSASVGDLGWISGGNNGVQTGHFTDNANLDFPAVQSPSVVGAFLPTSGKYSGTNYLYLLASDTYYSPTAMTVPGGKAMAIAGNATLVVNGDFTVSGSGFVYLYPGASLRLYVNGAFTVSGGGIMNSTLRASNMSVYGLNNSTVNWTYSGSSAFIGTVYAPNSNFTFSGGAGASGSFSANTITISGSAGVHYDENLGGSSKGYNVTSWNEL